MENHSHWKKMMRILVSAKLSVLDPADWETNESLTRIKHDADVYVNELVTLVDGRLGLEMYGSCPHWKFQGKPILENADRSAPLELNTQRVIREKFYRHVRYYAVIYGQLEIVASNSATLRWCKDAVADVLPKVRFIRAFVRTFRNWLNAGRLPVFVGADVTLPMHDNRGL
jgi:hypothetical protein